MQYIYLDHAATTQTAPEVVEKMMPYFSEVYGNPSSVYGFAGRAKKAVAESREAISQCLHAKENEIYFTGSASEADNWALSEILEANADKGNHIITSQIEHPAILNTCHYLEKKGYRVTYVPVDRDGLVSLSDLEAAICDQTVLISIMTANNEVGTIEPIEKIGAIAAQHGTLFHTDAVQGFGHVPIDVEKNHIDLLSASGHKFYGPKGIGFLYIRNGVKIRSLIHGGAQERQRRAGTENVPGIVGIGCAAKRVVDRMDTLANQTELRDCLIDGILERVSNSHLNGGRENRLCNNVNIRFDDINAESLLIRLDMEGICASAGSACASGSLDASHVLLAMGLSEKEAKSSLRFTLGEQTTKDEIIKTMEAVSRHVAALRARQS